MTRFASSLLMVGLWGCGSSGLTLGELKAPILQVFAPPVEPSPWEEPLIIFLSEGGDGCPDLSSDTKAFLNDTPVPLNVAGHFEERGSFLIATPAKCHSTSFLARSDELPPTREEVVRVRLTEGTTTFHAEVQNMCAARSFAMSSPAGGVLRPGEEVELEWQPATDELFPKRIVVKTGSSSKDLARHDDGTLQVEGNRMRFRVPPLEAGLQGSAELSVVGDARKLYFPRVTRCEGFTECHFDCGDSKPSQLSIPVTVQAM